MLVAARTPDVIARTDLAFGVHDGAFQHIGLFDFHVFVQRQFGAGLPTEQGGEQPAFLVLHQHLHVDAFHLGGFPG
ncbi:hypothetical protein D3C78_1854560 [compost metagenome]